MTNKSLSGLIAALVSVMKHNLAWFGHFLFGDPKPDLTLPLK